MRQAIFAVHKYLGFTLGAYLLVICASGGVLVLLEDQIPGFRDFPVRHVEVRPHRVSLDAIVARVRATYPGEHITHVLRSCEAGCTDDVSIERPGGDRLDVLLDPYTAMIVASVLRSDSAIGRLYEFHADLFLGDEGSTINSIAALVALSLLATGAYLWPGWRRPARGFAVRRNGGSWRANFDIHKIVGIVSVAFLAVIVLSGVAGVLLPEPPVVGASTTAPGARPLSLDAIVAAADKALPGEVTMIYPPASTDSTAVIRKVVPGDPDPYGWSYVSVDRYTGKIVALDDASKWPIAARAYTYYYPLHIGSVGGYPLRLFWVALAFAPSALYATGFLMWLTRLQRDRAAVTP